MRRGPFCALLHGHPIASGQNAPNSACTLRDPKPIPKVSTLKAIPCMLMESIPSDKLITASNINMIDTTSFSQNLTQNLAQKLPSDF